MFYRIIYVITSYIRFTIKYQKDIRYSIKCSAGAQMVLRNTGTFKFSHKGKTGILYIPADIVKDSRFPLKEGNVTVEISGDILIIRLKRKVSVQ